MQYCVSRTALYSTRSIADTEEENAVMIDFACKRISEEDVLRCAFTLSRTELALLKKMLAQRKETTAQELASSCKRDVTTVQRSLKRLHEKDLVKRFQHNFDTGGYEYTYQLIGRNQLLARIRENLERFTDTVLRSLDRF